MGELAGEVPLGSWSRPFWLLEPTGGHWVWHSWDSARLSKPPLRVPSIPDRYLIKFLAKLAQFSDVNKMTPSNIAIVLGPNLLWAKQEG